MPTLVPTPGLNVAFTHTGLQKLGVDGPAGTQGLQAFRDGMASRTATLSDPPASTWRILRPNRRPDGVFILTGASEAEIADTISLRLAPVPANGWRILHEEAGRVRPQPVKGHEHFGYADGVSQPGVRGRVEPGKALNADFHAASSTLVSGELVAESSVAPPGDGDGGEFGLA